jgi:hypothetical protein
VNTQELITKAAAEILLYERPARITAVAMLEILKLQADKIAELEKEQVVLKKFIDLQGEVVKASDAEITEKDKRIAELEAVADDLLNNSSFSIGFPFEHDKLEKLRGK